MGGRWIKISRGRSILTWQKGCNFSYGVHLVHYQGVDWTLFIFCYCYDLVISNQVCNNNNVQCAHHFIIFLVGVLENFSRMCIPPPDNLPLKIFCHCYKSYDNSLAISQFPIVLQRLNSCVCITRITSLALWKHHINLLLQHGVSTKLN